MFNIQEAFAHSLNNGKRIIQKELAAELWPDSSAKTQQTNMTNLSAGQRLAIRPEWVEKVCEATGVDANFLFGIPAMKTQVVCDRDKNMIQSILRERFDDKLNHTLSECLDIISLSKSLGLDREFIYTLQSDYDIELANFI